MDEWIQKRAGILTGQLARCQACPAGMNTDSSVNLAGQQAIQDVLADVLALIFPGCHGVAPVAGTTLGLDVRKRLERTAHALCDQIARAFQYQCEFERCKECGDCLKRAQTVVEGFLDGLPAVRDVIHLDVQAAYEGDPAAQSSMEVVISYPGVYAVTVHRVAHELHRAGVPLIPRTMTELAHARTGIDIHPGATIGPGFFIDHGTGVVIGETCEIGTQVKLYQGVTLGALSFAKDEKGQLVKGIKRHPNVEDHVIIYAGATILGGETIIGHHSVIGGNVWLVHSVPPYSKVYNKQPKPLITRVRDDEDSA